MEEYRHSFRGPGGERRLEIVNGKGFSSANQAYTHRGSRPRSPSPDLPPSQFQMQVHQPSQVASSSSKPWGFSDPEMKRIAKYKVYSIEGRFKASIRNGLRWIKNTCSEIIRGY